MTDTFIGAWVQMLSCMLNGAPLHKGRGYVLSSPTVYYEIKLAID